MPEFWPELVAALGGVVLGFIGTLIGAGGGFLLVPILVFLEPQWSTEIVTAFSLAVVAANASTGALSYWLQKRVDVRSFVIFALAATPGSIAGAYVSAYIPRRIFDPAFGGVLLLIALWLFVRPSRLDSTAPATGNTSRQLVDAAGNQHAWSFDAATGIAGSALVGFVSSLLGIGGGIIHVPFLVALLNFPEHIATATSHAVLAVTSIAGALVHAARGDYRTDGWPVLACCVGAIAGAPLGARVSLHVPGPLILRILAIGLAFVGLRLMYTALAHN